MKAPSRSVYSIPITSAVIKSQTKEDRRKRKSLKVLLMCKCLSDLGEFSAKRQCNTAECEMQLNLVVNQKFRLMCVPIRVCAIAVNRNLARLLPMVMNLIFVFASARLIGNSERVE